MFDSFEVTIMVIGVSISWHGLLLQLLTFVINSVFGPTGQSYVQWTSFYVFADVEKMSTEEPE